MQILNVVSRKILDVSSLLGFHRKSFKYFGSLIRSSLDAIQYEDNQLPSVVIIGAGISGLTAAEILLQNGITNVRIVEASGRLGGRVYTKKWHNATCELGSKYVDFPFDEAVISQVYGNVTLENETHSDYLFYKSDGSLINRNVSKIVRNKFLTLLTTKESIEDVMLIVDPKTNEFDDFIKDVQKQCTHINREDIACVMNGVLNTMRCRFGTDLQNINFDLCKHKVPKTKKTGLPFGCSSFLNLLDIPTITDLISFHSPVESIKRKCNYPEALMTTVTLNGKSYDSDYVICTIPHGTLKALEEMIFDPSLPYDRLQSMNKIGVGNVERIFLMFEEPIAEWFTGPVHFAWSPNELEDRRHWSTGTCTLNKLADSENILEVTVAGFQAEDICIISDDIVMTDVHSTLKKFLGNPQIPYPLDILRSGWSKDICSLGSLVYPTKNARIADLIALENTANFQFPDYSRLLFAGDATICNHFGTMHGARLSGIREANRIIERVKNKTFLRK